MLLVFGFDIKVTRGHTESLTMTNGTDFGVNVMYSVCAQFLTRLIPSVSFLD